MLLQGEVLALLFVADLIKYLSMTIEAFTATRIIIYYKEVPVTPQTTTKAHLTMFMCIFRVDSQHTNSP